jgi:hypothetical protein
MAMRVTASSICRYSACHRRTDRLLLQQDFRRDLRLVPASPADLMFATRHVARCARMDAGGYLFGSAAVDLARLNRT